MLQNPHHHRHGERQGRGGHGRSASFGRLAGPARVGEATARQISHAIPPGHQSIHAQKPQNINDSTSTLEIHSEELHAKLLDDRGAWPRCRWAVAGPGRTTSRRAERSSRRGRLAGGPPPTDTHSGRALRRPEHPWAHNTTRPRPVSRPRPRHAHAAPLSKAARRRSAPFTTAPPAIRRSCPRDPRPRRGQPRGGRRGRGTGSRTRSPGPQCGRSGSTAGRHRAHHTRRA